MMILQFDDWVLAKVNKVQLDIRKIGKYASKATTWAAFSGYTIYLLYYAGVSIMPPRGQLRGGFYNASAGVLASGSKPCGGNYAGVSIMPPWVLAQRPKPCGGNNSSTKRNCVRKHITIHQLEYYWIDTL